MARLALSAPKPKPISGKELGFLTAQEMADWLISTPDAVRHYYKVKFTDIDLSRDAFHVSNYDCLFAITRHAYMNLIKEHFGSKKKDEEKKDMKALQVINQQEVFGKQMQIYGDVQNPLFLAKDVAEWIEHSDVSTMLRTVDEDEKVTNNVCTHGGNQQAWFLTENGLYEVLMLSRKPIAKQFKKKVKEILRQLRLEGSVKIENHPKQQQPQPVAKPDKRLEIMEMNARTRQAAIIRLLIAEHPDLHPTAKAAIVVNTVNMLTGQRQLEQPETEKHYTAGDLAKEFGVTAMKIGQVANANNIKVDANGMLVLDKSPHSNKQVESWRYNENGRAAVAAALGR